MPLIDQAWYVDGSTGIAVTDLGSANNAVGATLNFATSAAIPAGALIVVVVNEAVATTSGTLSDGGSNTYSSVGLTLSTNAGCVTVFYIWNCVSLASATFTFTKAGTGHAVTAEAFYATGIKTSSDPRDTGFQNTSAVNSAAPTVTSNAPTNPGELVLGVCAYGNAVARTYTQDTTHNFNVPLTAINTQATASIGGGHLNVCGSLAVTFAPTLSGTADTGMMLLAFQAANTPVGWWNVTKWAASNTQHAGDIVRQNATPAINAERTFVCVASTAGTGTTAASEPAWLTTAAATRGVKFTDNTVTWQEATGVAALNGDYGAALTGTTNAITAAGSAVLHFASSPVVPIGARANDQTALTVIPANTTVLARDATTITLSANVTGAGVGSGDVIGFSNCPRWFDVKNTACVLGQVIQSGDGTKILICITAGTAGNSTEPTWPSFANAGTDTTDNTAHWGVIAAVPSGFSAWVAPQARLLNALTTNWAQASNKVFIGDNHAESQASAMLIASNPGAGTIAAMCVDHTAALPPGSANLMTTATVSTTGNSNITVLSSGSATVSLYCYGITFNCGTGPNNTQLLLGQTNSSNYQELILDACVLALPATGSTAKIVLGQNAQSPLKLEMNNTTVSLSAAGQTLNAYAPFLEWRNTASAVVGTVPTTLFTPVAGASSPIDIKGVDLSALGSGKTIVGAGSANFRLRMSDCKLGASVTKAATPSGPGQTIDIVRCDSGATNYIDERYWFQGTQTIETTIIRTGGASDGVTGTAWKLVTTSNVSWVSPFESQPITVWNDTVGSSITVTLYGIWGGAAVPNSDDIWIEAEYLGSTLTPMGSFATDTKANNLAAGTALATDASTWGGSTTAFSMSLSFTPQMKGPINLTIKAAKASQTFYVDPRPVITGVSTPKSYIAAPGVYVNERFAGMPASRLQLGM